MRRPGPAVTRLLALAAVLGAFFALGLLVAPRDADQLRDRVEEAGAWAPLAFAAGVAVLVVLFFPFPLLAGVGGVLFGTLEGALLALAGELAGACAAFTIARRAGRDPTARLAGRRLKPVLDAVARRGFSAVLLARVLPGVPRHPANYAFGLTSVGFGTFLAATAIGGAPRAFGYAALGGSLGDLSSPASLGAVAGLAAVGALGVWLASRDPELRAALREARRRRRGIRRP